MKARLDGKVCLVTGASRGIGAAIAFALAESGAQVVAHYGKNQDLAQKVVEDLPGEGHFAISANLANPDCVDGFVEDVADRTGRLDILVNNAGIYVPHEPLQTKPDEWLYKWEHTLAVNLLSPAALCHSVAGMMKEQGGGRIVNIGSRGAFRGEPKGPAYAASKAGLHAMSQSLAIALAPSGILVYAIAPGFVATDMAAELLEGEQGEAIRSQSPMNRVATPEEIAEVVVFLASSDGQFMSGGIIDVNGASYLRQ